MGKNTDTIRYETVVQLLLLAAAVLTPVLVSISMDLELFSVSKTMFITLCSSINPWLYPPYVYLLINFIIVFIFASSYIHSNTITFNPTIHDHHNQSSQTDSFVESSLVSQSPELESLTDYDLKFDHTLETTMKDEKCDLKSRDIEEDTFKDRDLDDYRPEKTVDKRELRKSKTFHEGGSRWVGRRERYVKILSQEELDRQVEEFIGKFKKEKNVHKSESNKGSEFGGVY